MVANKIQKPNTPVTTYTEKKIGKTLYRVTSFYKGEIDLAKALEDITVRKILQHEKQSGQSLQCVKNISKVYKKGAAIF